MAGIVAASSAGARHRGLRPARHSQKPTRAQQVEAEAGGVGGVLDGGVFAQEAPLAGQRGEGVLCSAKAVSLTGVAGSRSGATDVARVADDAAAEHAAAEALHKLKLATHLVLAAVRQLDQGAPDKCLTNAGSVEDRVGGCVVEDAHERQGADGDRRGRVPAAWLTPARPTSRRGPQTAGRGSRQSPGGRLGEYLRQGRPHRPQAHHAGSRHDHTFRRPCLVRSGVQAQRPGSSRPRLRRRQPVFAVERDFVGVHSSTAEAHERPSSHSFEQVRLTLRTPTRFTGLTAAGRRRGTRPGRAASSHRARSHGGPRLFRNRSAAGPRSRSRHRRSAPDSQAAGRRERRRGRRAVELHGQLDGCRVDDDAHAWHVRTSWRYGMARLLQVGQLLADGLLQLFGLRGDLFELGCWVGTRSRRWASPARVATSRQALAASSSARSAAKRSPRASSSRMREEIAASPFTAATPRRPAVWKSRRVAGDRGEVRQG